MLRQAKEKFALVQGRSAQGRYRGRRARRWRARRRRWRQRKPTASNFAQEAGTGRAPGRRSSAAQRAGRDLATRSSTTPRSYAPIDGVVLVKSAEAGEVLAAGTTIVTVGDLDHPWLRAYVGETDLGRVKLGEKVKLSTDSYPGKAYWGTVSFISSEAEFTPKQIQTKEERVEAGLPHQSGRRQHGARIEEQHARGCGDSAVGAERMSIIHGRKLDARLSGSARR